MIDVMTVRRARAYIFSSHTGPRFMADVLSQAQRIASACADGVHVLVQTEIEGHCEGRERPILDQMLEDLASPLSRTDRLIVCAEDKVASNPARLAEVNAKLAAAGVHLHVVGSNRRTRTAPMTVDTL